MTSTEHTEGHSSKPTHHFGRGGAGNVVTKDAKSPLLVPTGTPTLKSHHYTTGRGGTGNMAKNDDPTEARLAQDVDVPGIMLPEGQQHVGRGGAANVYSPTEDELKAVRDNNDHVRRESQNKADKSALKQLKDKGKELFAGKSKEER